MDNDKTSNTNAFTFMRSYHEQIAQVEEMAGKEEAYELYKAIVTYALEHKPYTGDSQLVRLVMHGVYPVIDKRGSRRKASQKNGGKGGRPPKTKEESAGSDEDYHPERTAEYLKAFSADMNLNATDQQIQKFIAYHQMHDWKKASTPDQAEKMFVGWIEKDKETARTRTATRAYIPEGRSDQELNAQIIELERISNLQLANRS